MERRSQTEGRKNQFRAAAKRSLQKMERTRLLVPAPREAPSVHVNQAPPLPSLQGPKHPSKIHWLPLKDLSRQELKESKRFMSSQAHRWKAMFGKQCFEVSPWSPQDPECQNLQTLLPHVQPGNVTVKPGNRVDFLLLWLHEQITGCLCNKAANQSKFSELEAKHNSLRISNLWYLFYSPPQIVH